MVATFSCDVPSCSSQAPTTLNTVAIDPDNLTDAIFQNFQQNLKPCKSFDLSNQKLNFDNTSTNLIIHLNISSSQAHFDKLNDFPTRFSNPPSIILLSETRINVNPCININIPGYTFVHLPSPAKAGGVGAYLSTDLIYTEIESLQLQVRDCEDLWFEVEFPGKQNT